MKTFDQLDPEEQLRAKEAMTFILVTAIVNGELAFNDEQNGNSLQARIDAAKTAAALDKSRSVQDMILKAIGVELMSIAEGEAKTILYSEPGERILEGIVQIRKELTN